MEFVTKVLITTLLGGVAGAFASMIVDMMLGYPRVGYKIVNCFMAVTIAGAVGLLGLGILQLWL